mgnify:CR=1 FL=1
MLTELSWLLVALPLLGAAVLLLGGRLTDSFGPLLATALSWGSFAVGAAIFVGMLGTDAHDRSGRLELWDWVPAGNIDVTAGLLVVFFLDRPYADNHGSIAPVEMTRTLARIDVGVQAPCDERGDPR